MGVTRRKCGTWNLNYMVGGKQVFESTGSKSKRFAQKLLAIRKAEVLEGRFQFVSSRPPTLGEWSDQFLESVQNPSTKRGYTSNVKSLKQFFGADTRLSHITVRRIEEYKRKRLVPGTGPAIINRDLAVLRTMLNRAARQKLIGRNPFQDVDFLDERSVRRQPHILTFEEQEKLLAVAPPRIRSLVVLITETGLRINREALALKWEDIDFANDSLFVRQSKTPSGRRRIPLSTLCKAELLKWRDLLGPEFSQFVFPRMDGTRNPLQGGRKSWVSALKKAGISFFPIYNLRATFASRLSAAGCPDTFVAQMMGHSTTSILSTYSKAVDEFRRDAIRKLEEHRQSANRVQNPESPPAARQPN